MRRIRLVTSTNMKRTGFRKPTYEEVLLMAKAKEGKPMMGSKLYITRNKPLRKTSKAPISKLKAKLWKVFSEWVRKRDGGVCFICERKCEGSGYHAAHFIPKSVGGIVLYFHPDNVHGCCYHCNINLGGNLYEYSLKLGPEKVAELYALKNGPPQKWDTARYEFEINFYQTLLSEMV